MVETEEIKTETQEEPTEIPHNVDPVSGHKIPL